MINPNNNHETNTCSCADCDTYLVAAYGEEHGPGCACGCGGDLPWLTDEELAAEALADAQQEALTDDTCYCDDVDICPPCARYLAMRPVCVFETDTTPAVGMTAAQVAAYEAEYGEDIYGRPL